MMKRYIRQGDLLFIPADRMPNHPQPKRVENGILAEGEATGHHHRVAVLEDAEVFELGEMKFLRVGTKGVSIIHEEHRTVMLEPDTSYEVHRAREYDPLQDASRFVAD